MFDSCPTMLKIRRMSTADRHSRGLVGFKVDNYCSGTKLAAVGQNESVGLVSTCFAFHEELWSENA